MTIEEFIEARIAEREDAARATAEIGQKYTPEGYSHEYEWARILINPNGKRQGSYTFEPGAPSPEEVLRQCVALRKILNEHVPIKRIDYLSRPRVEIDVCECCSYLAPAATDAEDECVSWPCDQIKAIAVIWSNHPEYNEGWKP